MHEFFETLLLIVLAAYGALYIAGVSRLWREAGVGRGVEWLQVFAFAASWILLIAALVSPLAEMSRTMFSAHMVVHEILMVGAAPLLVLSRPLAALAWALPRPVIHLSRWKNSASRRFGWLASPAFATIIQAAAIWIWHIPDLFRAAASHEGLHTTQHITFFASALLFWQAMHRIGRVRSGAATGYLFMTSLHTNFLGALLTLAPHVLYPAQGGLGLSALEDQQLGGIIMWIPGGMAYAVAALVMAARWISHDHDENRNGNDLNWLSEPRRFRNPGA